MLLSVLLPTHDRLEYLRYAIESVGRQDSDDWEIVVSDNASTEDVAGHVAGLNDPRIRYVRTDRFVPVTENWNNALRHSRGDYAVMLGDDDALLPGYCAALAQIVERFEHPDVVYTGALLFAYPGVLPDEPGGYVQSYSYAPFFAGAGAPFVLPPAQARALVCDAMGFRVSYGFNMQYAAVSRTALEELADGADFFASPFPDYYAMNLLFARAGKIVIDPEERVAIGITNRSYGYFHSNQRDAEARALLNNEATEPEIRRELEHILMPGTNINTGWLLAMEALHRRLGRPADLRPDYDRYRRLQAVFSYQHHYFDGSVTSADLAAVSKRLKRRERLPLLVAASLAGRLARVLPDRLRRGAGMVLDLALGQFRRSWRPPRTVGRYANVIELYESLDVQSSASHRPGGQALAPPVLASVQCSVCPGRAPAAFHARDRNRRLSDEVFTYYRCTRCGTVQLVPVPGDLGRYYPPEYYTIPKDRAALISASGGERYKLEIVRRFVPSGRVVEIGPAIGGFAAVMQEAGYDASAIEMNADCCRFLRTAIGIRVQESDDPIAALAALAADGPFDVVAMWHVIEHLPNPRDVLAAAGSALRPGGIVVLAAPNPAAFQFRLLGPRWTHLDAPRHLFLIPAEELVHIGQELGLEMALMTTQDAGTLAWNVFGWRESLAGFARGRYPRSALRLVGSVLARAAAPLDHRDQRGSTYTLVLRRPASSLHPPNPGVSSPGPAQRTYHPSRGCRTAGS